MAPKIAFPKGKAKAKAKAKVRMQPLRGPGHTVPALLTRLVNKSWQEALYNGFHEADKTRIASFLLHRCNPIHEQFWVNLMWKKIPPHIFLGIHSRYVQHKLALGRNLRAYPILTLSQDGAVTGFA